MWEMKTVQLDNQPEIDRLLERGWEPFAATTVHENAMWFTLVLFRRWREQP